MDRIILDTLKPGQKVTMHAGEAEQKYTYEFVVRRAGELPIGLLFQTDPRGNRVGPGEAELLGSGRWTTPEQNPMQRADWFIGRPQQDKALTIGWGILYIGGCAVVRNPNEKENTFYELQPSLTDIQIGEQSEPVA